MADFTRHRRASCLAHSTGCDAKRWHKTRVTTAHLVGAGGVQNFKMVPAAPGVNSSVEEYTSPRSCAPTPRKPATIVCDAMHQTNYADAQFVWCIASQTMVAGLRGVGAQ